MLNISFYIRAKCFDSTESSSGPRVLDLYKECTTHCGISNAYNKRDKFTKPVNNTEYECVGLCGISGIYFTYLSPTFIIPFNAMWSHIRLMFTIIDTVYNVINSITSSTC